MTSGVSRSRSLPCSAMAGEATTSAIKAMQTLRTRRMIANASAQLRFSIECGENSDRLHTQAMAKIA